MQIKYFNFFVDASARKIFDFIYAELFVHAFILAKFL